MLSGVYLLAKTCQNVSYPLVPPPSSVGVRPQRVTPTGVAALPIGMVFRLITCLWEGGAMCSVGSAGRNSGRSSVAPNFEFRMCYVCVWLPWRGPVFGGCITVQA